MLYAEAPNIRGKSIVRFLKPLIYPNFEGASRAVCAEMKRRRTQAVPVQELGNAYFRKTRTVVVGRFAL